MEDGEKIPLSAVDRQKEGEKRRRAWRGGRTDRREMLFRLSCRQSHAASHLSRHRNKRASPVSLYNVWVARDGGGREREREREGGRERAPFEKNEKRGLSDSPLGKYGRQ
jgi:hypothetical protein